MSTADKDSVELLLQYIQSTKSLNERVVSIIMSLLEFDESPLYQLVTLINGLREMRPTTLMKNDIV